MPVNNNGRDVQMLQEGSCFSKSKSQWPQSCNHHKPSIEELQSISFSDFVRRVVLKGAERGYVDDGLAGSDLIARKKHMVEWKLPAAKDIVNTPPISFRNGMAKVTLPKGFVESGGVDRTGRGIAWQAGSELGDIIVPAPIKQVVRGIGGIYEYTLVDMDPMTVAEYREKADEYLKSQLGEKAEDLSIEMLQRKFWKRLGPTMKPTLYGADMEGTLFKKHDYCCGWNISKLHSCLGLLQYDQPLDHEGGIPGVTTPYLYFGMWASVFCAHTEDMNLLSINYLHAGAPKVWYAIAAGEDAKRFEQLCEGHFHHAKSSCPEYMRHKRAMVSPAILKKAGIPFTTTVQYPGDAMITFPGSYHFGFNTGFNVAEATNFGVPEWIPYGKLANVCLCRPDSVRIEMQKFEKILLQYEKEVKSSRRMHWGDWAIKLRKKRHENSSEDRQSLSAKKLTKNNRIKKGSQRKPFWVEVMSPVIMRKTKTQKASKKRKKEEIWHLAKPGGRKSLCASARVLCIVPAVVNYTAESSDASGDEEEDEECFMGYILEVKDDHVRVRFDGMNKSEDMWLSIDSPKIFLDGGRWDENSKEDLPKLHFWNIEDSKKKCI